MAWLVFLNLLMLSRLWYLRQETPAGIAGTAVTGILQIAFVTLFEPGWQQGLLAAIVLAVNALLPIAERRSAHPAGPRALALLALALASGVLLDNAAGFAPWTIAAFNALNSFLGWTSASAADGWHNLNVLLFGLLVLTNEVNLAIRYGFRQLDLEPKLLADPHHASTAGRDDRAYSAGRVIGILERYLIFAVLVAGGDYTVIAVVIAAKGIARFKQLDHREFAEYVLIGTLASILSAVVTAQAVIALQ